MNAIETLALQEIGEDVASPDVFTDDASGLALIRESANHAIAEICALSGGHVRVYRLPLLAGRQFYRLRWERDYFGYVLECWDRANHRRLTQTNVLAIARRDPYWMKSTGTPTHYLPLGQDTVGFWRYPSAAGSVIELTCAAIPKPYTADTDPVRLREQWERAAAYHAVSEYYASRGDAGRATEWYRQYLDLAGLSYLTPQAAERVYSMGQPDDRRPQWRAP